MSPRPRPVLAALGVAALVLTGCAAAGPPDRPQGDRTPSPIADYAEQVFGGSADPDGDGGDEPLVENGDEQEVVLAAPQGWEEGEAVSELWRYVLEDEGYSVTIEYVDTGVVFEGLAAGDFDIALDTWMPDTHGAYVDQRQDELVDLGAWYSGARLMLVVNEDAPVDSIDELAEHASDFGGSIYGIEPGSGLNSAIEDSVIPEYGLEGMELVPSSTPALLAELEAAAAAGEDIVAGLWTPHWALDEYPIRPLEDPQGAFGQVETINGFARADLDLTHPALMEWLLEFEMDPELLHSLQNAAFNADGGAADVGQAVQEWAAEHEEYVDGLTG